jgi:iron(III) transport system permease protein
MISPLVLERPGRWRGAGLAAGFALAALPVAAAAWSLGFGGDGTGTLVPDSSFAPAVWRSMEVGAAVCLVAVVLGLPTGLLAAMYAVPGRRFLLGMAALPLLVPSFLWAIGLSMLRIALGMPHDGMLSGFSGTVLVFSASAVPLVVLASFAAARLISQGEADAARMAGGEWRLLVCAARSVFPVALATGMLGGILTLSDPGPGQILGFDGAASHILVSFAAQHDPAMATRQSLCLAAVVLGFAVPLAFWLSPRMASALLARQTKPVRPERKISLSWFGAALLAGIVGAGVVLPLAGLLQPLGHGVPVRQALDTAGRTMGDTVYHALVAGGIGTLLGVAMALCAGRQRRWRAVLLGGSLLVFALPTALSCMGVMFLAGVSPPMLDPLTRSHFTVGLIEALRLFPLAALLTMRALGSASPEWTAAAAIHGLPLRTYLARVLVPWLLPAAGIGALFIGLLATADITSAQLLTPPGGGSLPLAIFTVMANAPEARVGALCLLYVGGAALTLGAALAISGFVRRRANRS